MWGVGTEVDSTCDKLSLSNRVSCKGRRGLLTDSSIAKTEDQITQDKDPEKEVTLMGTCGLQYLCWARVSRLECGEPLE